MIGPSRTFRPSHLAAAGFGLAGALILGGAFALSATREEAPETDRVTVAPTTEGQTTTSGPTTGPTTTEATGKELLFADDFSNYDSGVFEVEATEFEDQVLSIGFESSNPVPALRIEVEMTETAGEGSHYLGVACVHLDTDYQRSAFAFGIDSRTQSYDIVSEGPGASAQLDKAVRGEIRKPPRTNRVRVECVERGNVTRLKIFTNGRRLTEIGAPSIGGFNQAALVATSSTGSAAGYFDNLKVWSIGN